jgi:glycosyltransferase involved in cell wall biosynthesis
MARGGGDSAHELEKTLGLQTSHPRVGIVGNIQRWKGQMVFLGAMKIISPEFPKLKCLIVGSVSTGEEEYQRELEDYVKANRLEDKVIFTGFRRDILDVVEMMDVLVHASIEPEPFSRMILEGMAAAKPIVATNSGGTPEQIVDGETGKLVPMKDPEKMAEAIRWMLLNLKEARKMGEAGRQRLIERFSIEQMVAGVERVYDDIFEKGEGTRISAGIS